MNERVEDFEISHGVNLTGLNMRYRWPALLDEQVVGMHLEPYMGAGVVGYAPHAEGRVNGVGVSGDYQLAGFGGQVLAGAEYRFARILGVFIETKFDLGRLDIDLDRGARAETLLRTLHGLIGVTLHLRTNSAGKARNADH